VLISEIQCRIDSDLEVVPSLLRKVGIVGKPQTKVLTMLFATISIACGKVNFTNLSRYSPLSEKTYRRVFAKWFDFTLFNQVPFTQSELHTTPIPAKQGFTFAG
jgi:hypothetical protein